MHKAECVMLKSMSLVVSEGGDDLCTQYSVPRKPFIVPSRPSLLAYSFLHIRS
jgi:hypothetical protein